MRGCQDGVVTQVSWNYFPGTSCGYSSVLWG